MDQQRSNTSADVPMSHDVPSGLPWSPEEIQALVTLWARKSVQKQLLNPRNKQVFIGISTKLASLGYHRDPISCRNKIHKLRTAYKKIKEHNSGSGISRHNGGVWFALMDDVLKHQPGESSISDAAGDVSVETDVWCKPVESAPPPSPSCLQPDTDQSEAHRWIKEETRALLELWGDGSVQEQLNNTWRTGHIYSLLSGQLAALGFHKTPGQCRDKIKKLKSEYKRVKASGSSKHGGSSWSWFSLMDAVLGRQRADLDRPAGTSRDGSAEKLDESSPDGVLERADNPEKSPCWPADGVPHVSGYQAGSLGFEAVNCVPGSAVQDSLSLTNHNELSQSGVFSDVGPSSEPTLQDMPSLTAEYPDLSSWLPDETRLFLTCWGEPGVQEQLNSALRNQPVFWRITRQLASAGFHKTPQQCKDKLKKLKQTYWKIKTSQVPLRNLDIKWFSIMDAVLGGSAAPENEGSGREEPKVDFKSRPAAAEPAPPLTPEVDRGGQQLTRSTLSLMVPTLRLMSAFAWHVVQSCNVMHYGKVEELVQLVTEVVPHLLSDREKVDLLYGLRARPAAGVHFYEEDLQTLVWEFISRLDKLLPLPDIQQTAELLSAAPSLLEECGQLEFEAAQLKTLLHHTTLQGIAKEYPSTQAEPHPAASMTPRSPPEPSSQSQVDRATAGSWVQHQSTIPSTPWSTQTKPQQGGSNRKRCRRKALTPRRKLSPPHRTEEDKDRQSEYSMEEEEGAEGTQSDKEWVPENCSENKRRRNETADLKKGRANSSCSVRRSGAAHLTAARLHTCTLCSFTHSQEDGLLQHIREEHITGEPSGVAADPAHKSDDLLHRCSHCGADFKTRQHLTRHMGIHTGPYRCGQCVKRYRFRYELIRHRRRAHTAEQAFTCAHCGRQGPCRGDPALLGRPGTLASATAVTDPTQAEPDPAASMTPPEPPSQSQVDHASAGTDHVTAARPHTCCSLCSFTHGQEEGVLQHIREERVARKPRAAAKPVHKHSDLLHRCSHCGAEFKTRQHLTRHMMTRHMGNHMLTLRCDQCDKSYPNKRQLIIHQRLHTGKRPFTCTHCGRGFRSSATLSFHVRTHTGERRYACHVCGKTSIQPMARHMLMHKGEKNFLCTECGKAFLTNGELRLHARTHTGERPYTCTLCGKGFPAKCHLTLHLRTHTGEKPYRCPHCSKAFPSSQARKRHMFIHADKKPFECFKCGKGIVQAYQLKLHIRKCNAKEMGRL